MKPKTPLFTKSIHATAFATAFTLCVAGFSNAAEFNWNTTTGDFNTAANWLVGAGPGTGVPGTLDNANIANGGTSQYTASTATTVAEVRAGNGAGGTLEVSGGGTFNTSGSTWAGRQNGSAIGTLTVSGTGTIFNVNGGNTLVGAGATGVGTATSGSTGVLNINSGAVFNHNPTGADTFRIGDTQAIAGNSGNYSGTLNVNGGTLNLPGARFYVGQNSVNGTATGVVNLASGAINVNNNWVVIGRAGGTGTLNVTGGTFTKAGANNFAVADNGGATGATVGTLTQSAGTINITGGQFFVGNGNTTTSTTGTYNLSGTGALNVNDWIAVGRGGANGTITITSGTITKTGTTGNGFTIATGGSTNTGTVNLSGGLLDIQQGPVFVAEGSVGTLNLSGTGEFRAPAVQVGANANAVGLLNLSGGTLKTRRIFGGNGSAEVDFNGTLIQATSTQAAFIDNLDVADLRAGGAIIDSNGFDLGVGAGQSLTGTGGLTKQGLGTLTLLGSNSYTGATLVSGGKLVTTTGSYFANGPVTVAASASFGVNVLVQGDGIAPSSLTLGASSGVDINLGSNGNATFAPIDVAGALTINSGAGTIPINLTGTNLGSGQFPVIHYSSLAGTGGFASFKVGSLPLGVTATLVNNTASKTIDLKITVKSPVWTGAISSAWDTVTANWMDASSFAPITFADGDPVLFSDYAPDFSTVTTSDVTIASGVTVRPGALIQFNNSLIDYTLTGAGKISNPVSGTVGLTKQGTGSLTIGTINDFTGVTRIEGGRIDIDQLPNGGVASPIGAATAAPANLVLAGGVLRYTGGTASTNRGFTLAALNGTINVFDAASNLTISGAIAATGTASDFVKLGAGTLTLTGSGALSTGGNVRLNEGKTVIDGTGSAPAQLLTTAGGLWVGALAANEASLDLNNTSLSIGGWLAVGRGNGDTGNVSSVNMNGGTLTAGNLSTGFANGLPNLATQNLTFNNATVTITGASNLAENRGSTSNITLTGNTVFNTREILMALGGGPAAGASVVNFTVGDSSIVNVGSSTVLSYVSIGRDGGTGNLIVKDNGQFLNYDDFTLGEVANNGGTGTITLQDNGIITVRTPLLGRGAGNTGLITQTGGTFSNFGDNNFQIGVNGNATWNLSAGTVNAYGWNSIARYASSTNSSLNISGGTYNQVANDRGLIVGEEGNGALNLSGTGILNVGGSFRVGFAATGTGTFNQTGGVLDIKNNVLLGERGTATATLSAGQLSMNTGTGAFNFVVGNFDNGKATLNISGTADVRLARNASFLVGNTSTTASNTINQTGGTVTAYSDNGTTVGGTGIVRLGNGTASGTNTYNLRGGTLATGGITSSVSTSILNLGGGTLKAVRDNDAFISGITVASIEAAGVAIDTSTFNVAVTSALQDAGGGGGITKNGTGTLTLAGQNTYLGNTAINGGGVTLADDGQLRFFIGANGVTNHLTGTGTATLNGDFNIELGSAAVANGNSWTLIDSSVNKSYGATFSVIGFAGSGGVWTRVEGGNTWKFTESTGVLSVTIGGVNAYDSWTSTYFPGVTDPNIIGPAKDPDGDGSSNALEFALGGVPNNGANGPKVYSLQEDTAVDVDTNKEELLTIAVRSGTPAFSAAASPSATTSDSLTVYTIQGSLDLATFTSPVTPVTPAVTTGLPAAPAGYEYRTFSLDSSNGLTGKGFLRVKVN